MELPSKWDHETEVLVVGYGVAGTAAAKKSYYESYRGVR